MKSKTATKLLKIRKCPISTHSRIEEFVRQESAIRSKNMTKEAATLELVNSGLNAKGF